MVNAQDALWGLTIYGGVVIVIAWIAMVIWAYRDIRARSRDLWAHILVGFLVLFLNVPGLLIYVFLRPRETLSEAYERSLEEEALLQEIEGKPSCPGCGQRVGEDWQACPYCHTRLKKPCIHCGQMLQLSWDLCPHCATPQAVGTPSERSHVSRSIRNVPDQRPPIESGYATNYNVDAQASLEFVDDDY